MEAYGDPLDSENVVVGSCESQLREDLAEAMLEISIASHRAPGKYVVAGRCSFKPAARGAFFPVGLLVGLRAACCRASSYAGSATGRVVDLASRCAGFRAG